MFSIFKKKKVVPHVRLTGVIGSAGRFNKGIDLAGQREILKKAFSLKKITHVAISINSPGGSPVQSHLIYSYIRQLAEKNKVKVIIFAEDVAASGGYLISCAGDEIYANSAYLELKNVLGEKLQKVEVLIEQKLKSEVDLIKRMSESILHMPQD